jgi:O-antigen ligase
MNTVRQRRSGALALPHPSVLDRRLSDMLLTGLTALLPTGLALAVVVGFPHASLPIVLGIIAGAIGIVALVVCSRLEVTVTLVLIYLLLLDGPIKMLTSQREATRTFADVVILAVCLGAVMRMTVQRKRIVLPPLSGWVIAWVVLVLVNAFNPRTHGFLAALGGFSQQLQYVPFFFFGFALMRSKRRFRQLFIIVGVAATASGIVAAYQTELTPAQLASWGPGYQNLIHPLGKGTGRVYFSEGEARVRPPGLGTEAGASGGIGHVALPMCLALVAISRGRKKWIAMALALGAMLAVIVGLGRLQLVGAALGVVAFAALAALTGRQVSRTLGALLAIVVLAIPAGALVVSSLQKGTFKRYESINTSSETTLHKENAFSKIPEYVAASPLGYGLGNSGAVAGLGGPETNSNLLEGHGLTSETQYNVLVKELGAPGLILWPLIAIYVSLLIVRRIRRIRDPELAICLAGALAAFAPLLIEGSSGFVSGSLAGGAYYWLAIGVVSYWLVGRKPTLPNPAQGIRDASPVAA